MYRFIFCLIRSWTPRPTWHFTSKTPRGPLHTSKSLQAGFAALQKVTKLLTTNCGVIITFCLLCVLISFCLWELMRSRTIMCSVCSVALSFLTSATYVAIFFSIVHDAFGPTLFPLTCIKAWRGLVSVIIWSGTRVMPSSFLPNLSKGASLIIVGITSMTETHSLGKSFNSTSKDRNVAVRHILAIQLFHSPLVSRQL